MQVKQVDFHDEMLDVIEEHQKDYRSGRGVWQRVDYTEDVFILVRAIRMRAYGHRYRIFLVDKATENFVSAMLLDPEKITFRHPEIFYVPTSFVLPSHRGRGLFLPLYRWFIDSGFKLKADSRQSEDSNRLWHRLITEYGYITVCDSKLMGDTYTQMLDPQRLRMKEYTTLLFNNEWTEDDIKAFADRLSRIY